MGFYTKRPEKKSGDGLALTEWNDLSNAVAGDAGLTLALNPEDRVSIGLPSPEATLDVARGNAPWGTAVLRGTQRHSHFNSGTDEHTYIRGGKWNASVIINEDGGNVGIGTLNPQAKLQVAGGAIMPSAGKDANSGIVFPKDAGGGSGDQAWLRYYARSGEEMTLELGISNDYNDHIALMPGSGNVGIGTNAPTSKLHVMGDAHITGKLILNQGVSFTDLTVSGKTNLNGSVDVGSKTQAAMMRIVKRSEDADGGTLILGPSASSGSNLRMGYHDSYSWIQSHGSKPLAINPIGNNVGIRTTNPQDELQVNGIIRMVRSGNYSRMYVGSRNLVFTLANSRMGANRSTSWDGDGNWDISSDRNLKQDIENETDILPRLLQLDVKNYNWKDAPDNEDKPKMIGFIAQDVEPLFPALVGEITNPDTQVSNLTLKYANFGVLAVGAIKELKQQHDARIANLEAEVRQLKEKLHFAEA